MFDVITLNHVIEHVHEPIKVLKLCHELLKPGGQLWLETPNIDSFGYARFKKNWRGLETPRHLILFNRSSLTQAFISAGFPLPNDCARPSPCVGIFMASFAMEHGYAPYQLLKVPKIFHWQAIMTGYAGNLLPFRREFITMTARKMKL